MVFTKLGYLSRSESFTINQEDSLSGFRLSSITLAAGDINCDNSVDMYDLVGLTEAYGCYSNCSDQDNWSLKADLNRDAQISLSDLVYLSRNFGLNGNSY